MLWRFNHTYEVFLLLFSFWKTQISHTHTHREFFVRLLWHVPTVASRLAPNLGKAAKKSIHSTYDMLWHAKSSKIAGSWILFSHYGNFVHRFWCIANICEKITNSTSTCLSPTFRTSCLSILSPLALPESRGPYHFQTNPNPTPSNHR